MTKQMYLEAEFSGQGKVRNHDGTEVSDCTFAIQYYIEVDNEKPTGKSATKGFVIPLPPVGYYVLDISGESKINFFVKKNGEFRFDGEIYT